MSGLSTPSLVSVPGFFTPFAFAQSIGSTSPISGSSAPSASAGSAVPILGLSAPSASAGSTGFAGPMFGLFTLSAYARSTVYVPDLSALSTSTPSASSGSAVPVPSLSAFAALVLQFFAFFALVMIPTSERQKLIELNRRKKKVTSKELAPVFTPLLLSKPPLFFSASYVSEKRSFDKVFDINRRSLANNQFGEDVDLSFMSF